MFMGKFSKISWLMKLHSYIAIAIIKSMIYKIQKY